MKSPFHISILLTLFLTPLHAGDISLLDYGTCAETPDCDHASGDFWTSDRPDGRAPAGVMADHTHGVGDHTHGGGHHGHGNGEWMLSFRYGYGHMTTNHVGNNEVSDQKIISPKGGGYMVTPTRMDMHMWMPSLMYAPSEKLTLMFMAPYLYKTMDHLRRDGQEFTTKSDGFGDLKFTPLVKLYDANRRTAHAGLGISAPTGSTDEEDFVPGPGNTRLPYPMQLGSGTWDLLPSLTWLGQNDDFSWGTQANGTIRVGTNGEGYTLGNGWGATAWGAAKVTDWASLSARVSYTSWGNIDGSDNGLLIPPGAVPTADPKLRGGGRVDLSFGFNLLKQDDALAGHRLGVEMGFPIYENLDGPQLGRDFFLMVGWQMAF